MRKWIWTLGAMALLLMSRLEHTGTDISQLEPVELVRVSANDAVVRIETDTGAVGMGQNLDEAVTDLHASASATVFLDTAEYLIISGEALGLLPELYDLLRPACRVCAAEGELDLQSSSEYLQAHPPKIKLLQCRAGAAELETLHFKEGRGQLAQ